jgi:hypothetical protein
MYEHCREIPAPRPMLEALKSGAKQRRKKWMLMEKRREVVKNELVIGSVRDLLTVPMELQKRRYSGCDVCAEFWLR